MFHVVSVDRCSRVGSKDRGRMGRQAEGENRHGLLLDFPHCKNATATDAGKTQTCVA